MGMVRFAVFFVVGMFLGLMVEGFSSVEVLSELVGAALEQAHRCF